MKFWSILTFMVFLNFTALPSIAALLDWELPRTNVILNEEEPHSNIFVVYEKAIPKPLDINEFLKFYETKVPENLFTQKKDLTYLSPHLKIFSPPPEV